MVCRSTDSYYKYSSFHSDVCIAFTDMTLILQEIPEASQWPSLMTLFWSLKEPHWSWSVTIPTVQLPISSGMSSTPGKDPSCSSSTFQGTPWFKALEASWLNLRTVNFPSTWGNSQPIGVTRLSTSVHWVAQCLGPQEELNTNHSRWWSFQTLKIASCFILSDLLLYDCKWGKESWADRGTFI